MSTSDNKRDLRGSERELLQRKLNEALNRELSLEEATELLQIAQRVLQIVIHDLNEFGPKFIKYGWYPVATQLPDEPALIGLIDNGDIEELDRRLVETIENALDEIEWDITQIAPTRRLPIKEAFEAHRNGKYYLSIPVVLAQAEGICIDSFGEKLFAARNGKSRISSSVLKLDKTHPQYDYQLSSMSLLAVLGAINATESHSEGLMIDFNRHRILHGKSTDYGTKINSCKAISLLAYVTNVVSAVFSRVIQQDSEADSGG
jgi:hypothetical protein